MKHYRHQSGFPRLAHVIGILLLTFGSGAVIAEERKEQSETAHLTIKAVPDSVLWGYYDAAAKPALTINSGEIVEGETLLIGAGYLRMLGVPEKWLRPEMHVIDAVKDRLGPHILVGPIYIRDAEPGDVLEVRILDVRVIEDFGITVFSPDSGTLPEDYPYARTKVIPLDIANNIAKFSDDVTIPMKPFFGSMGVAPPPAVGRVSSIPPGAHAGNLDNKELTKGSTLYLPVHVPGALFLFGDGHAAQGDGEVAGTAIETSLAGKFQFIVRKDLHLRWPHAETPMHYITMGLNEDLDIAIKTALREMIDYLVAQKGMSRDDAYMLCSMAVDIRITQLVDGTKGIHAILPKGIFKNSF